MAVYRWKKSLKKLRLVFCIPYIYKLQGNMNKYPKTKLGRMHEVTRKTFHNFPHRKSCNATFVLKARSESNKVYFI